MTISRAKITQYQTLMNQIASKAQIDLQTVLEKLNLAFAQGLITENDIMSFLVDSFLNIYETYSNVYGDITAELFSQLSNAEYGRGLQASVSKPADTKAIYKAINQAKSSDGVLAELDSFVRQRGRDTMSNAIQKYQNTGVRCALVPQGQTTCAFCTMLASRGFVYKFENLADAYLKTHNHCDCLLVPSWSSDPRVEGYDPDSLFEIYNDARKNVEDSAGKAHTNEILAEMRRVGNVSDATLTPE